MINYSLAGFHVAESTGEPAKGYPRLRRLVSRLNGQSHPPLLKETLEAARQMARRTLITFLQHSNDHRCV